MICHLLQRARTGKFITGGFALFATGAIVWDGVRNELKAGISCIDYKVDLTHNNVLFRQTILKVVNSNYAMVCLSPVKW